MDILQNGITQYLTVTLRFNVKYMQIWQGYWFCKMVFQMFLVKMAE